MKSNEPNSEKRQFYKRLLLIPIIAIATIVVIRIICSFFPSPFRSRQERIQDSLSTNTSNDTIPAIDTVVTYNDDLSLVNDFDLAWGTDRVNIKHALENIAGVEGSVDWHISYATAKQKGNPDLFTAIGHAENNDGKKPKTFDIILLVNRQNKQFKVVKAVDNGKVLKDRLDVVMSLALQGGYSQGIDL